MNTALKAKRDNGFTIVELLIVIIVIGILAVIIMISYNNVAKTARNTSRVQAAKSAVDLVQAYQATEGKYVYGSCTSEGYGCGCIGQGFPEGKCWGVDSPTPNYENNSPGGVNYALSSIGTLSPINYPPVDLGTWRAIGPLLHHYTPTVEHPARLVDGEERPQLIIDRKSVV